MRALVRLLLLGLVVTMIGPVRAAAQPAPAGSTDKMKLARQYVDAGLAAQNAGDYDTAVTLYSKAYQLVQHPVLIFDMAQAHRLAGHIDQALTLYARYLDEEPKGAQAQTARGLVTELEAQKARQVQAGGKARKAAPAGRSKPAGGADAGADEEPHEEPVGDTASGSLVVKARTERGDAVGDGTVMVDEEPRGKLARGKLTLQDLAEGRHTVAIEASGYRRFEDTVTVAAGEPASLDAVLRDKGQPASSTSSSRTLWRVSLGASVVVAVTGAAYAVYSSHKIDAHLALINILGSGGTGVSSEECGKSYATILNDTRDQTGEPTVIYFNYETFQRACTWKTRAYLGYLASGVGVLGAVISLIMLTREPEPPAGSHRKKAEVAIVPIVTPGGGGAQLSLAW
jgi:tetratricopeptide (TPR) repeat protein